MREKREREKEEVRKREGAARKKGNGEAENCRGVKELRGCVGQTEGTETDPLYSPVSSSVPCRLEEYGEIYLYRMRARDDSISPGRERERRR